MHMSGIVIAVSRSLKHAFSKLIQEKIFLQAGLGVEGDAHLGRPSNIARELRRIRVSLTSAKFI
jgi:hypothetical protein